VRAINIICRPVLIAVLFIAQCGAVWSVQPHECVMSHSPTSNAICCSLDRSLQRNETHISARISTENIHVVYTLCLLHVSLLYHPLHFSCRPCFVFNRFIMRSSLVGRIKCCTQSVRPSVRPCLRFSQNGKGVQNSNLVDIALEKSD